MESLVGLWQYAASFGSNLFWFLLILTVLVFFHELGHYFVARWCGVRIVVFSIGFGGELFGWNDRHGTRWRVSWIPLGGYVKFFGDAGAASTTGEGLAEMSEAERAVSFHHKPVGHRAAVVAAGPIANFILAVVLLAGLYVTVGQPFTPAVIDVVQPGSAAEEAGLRPGDRIVAIDGYEIERFETLQQIVSSSLGEPIEMLVERDGERITLVARPRMIEVTDRSGNVHRIGRLGVGVQRLDYVRHGPVAALWYASKETLFIAGATLEQVGQMIVGERSADGVSGPIGIFRMSGQAAEFGVATVVRLMALLSVSLGLINLFPIPILDGGHLMYYAFEAVRGRPLGERQQEYGFRIGLALIILLLAFATLNDVLRLPLMGYLVKLFS